MFASRSLLSFFVLLVLSLGGCDRRQGEIVGRWKAEGGSTGEALWEFSANGTVMMAGTRGRYTLGDGERLKIQTGAATFVQRLEMHGDEMTLTAPNGSSTHLKRIK